MEEMAVHYYCNSCGSMSAYSGRAGIFQYIRRKQGCNAYPRADAIRKERENPLFFFLKYSKQLRRLVIKHNISASVTLVVKFLRFFNWHIQR